MTVPEGIADLAYRGREARDGDGSATLRSFQNESDAHAAEGGGSTPVDRSVLVWWSHPPTHRQERQLEACLE